MAVYLRKKALAGGRQSLYLDIWHGEKRQYEFLKIILTPGDPDNKEKMAIAKRTRANRELELTGTENDYKPKFRRSADFVKYFARFMEQYPNKDVRLVQGAYNYFVKFLASEGMASVPATDVNQALCKRYVNYLEQHLHGETILNYFTKFKRCVTQAYEDKLLVNNPVQGIKVNRPRGLKKDILSQDEIALLAATPMHNDQVKRAFLFSTQTGLRWCDVSTIQWRDIDLRSGKLTFTQRKVAHSSGAAQLTIDLNANCLHLIGEPKAPTEPVFTMPTYEAANHSLKHWAKRAGITKNITWHGARHSFAVIQLTDCHTDVKTTAALLGHSGLRHVDVYLRVIDERKSEAVNKMKSIF